MINIYYDYCALIVEVLIFASLVIRKMTRGRFNRWALVLIGAIMVTTIADISAITYQMVGIDNHIPKYVANTLRILGMALISVLFCGYLFAMIGIWHKIRNSKLPRVIFNIPIVIMTVLIVAVNPFTKVLFYIGDDGMYHRGMFLPLIYLLSHSYLVIGCAAVIHYRKQFSVRRLISVFIVFGMILIGGIIQMFAPEINSYVFFLAASFLMMVLGIQSPEERVHGATGLYSMNAYVNDVNKYKRLSTRVGITLSVMTNYNSLIEMFGFYTVQNIIQIIAERLEKWAVESYFDVDLYYLGGGRFAVIADERFEDSMLKIAQDVNAELSGEVVIDEMIVKVMSNVCFVDFPKDIDDPRFLFSFDSRLEAEAYTGELRYAEKLFDKKRFEFRRDIVKILERALEKKLFYLKYQPVYSVRDNRYVRVEAFLRLNDPEFGIIRPDLMISEAEKVNSIHAITTYVIEEVCSFISSPDFLLLGLDHIEINLSAAQCMWSDLPGVLLSTLKAYNARVGNICFNITDVDNEEIFANMRDNIDALAKIGFGIYMDDFGAGIFEVERISKMPLSGIKFDRAFVKEGLKPENRVVFEGSLRMIEDLEIDSVAVGVENGEMKDRLIELGCNYMQGYHFCRPLEQKELIRFILTE